MANDYTLSVKGEFKDDISQNLEQVKHSVGDFSSSIKNAGSSVVGFGKLLAANLASTAITASLNAVKSGIQEVGQAVVDIGKQSYTAGAALEQSIGGIETLYKDSADTVKKYASDAWKTAGLSANEYMEESTSFAAALLQSVGGNTTKAAEAADRAIIDMSDNANKMGTNLEDIQNAYQGFAKQNYTMLDNLKLGYGGTKTEMQRLLKDAQRLTGVKYDINNLSDVYEAIHVVQKELDITGTTAKEASTTLEGSFNSMKSAWDNLKGDMALGKDLKADIKSLKSSLSTWTDNLMPVVEHMLDAAPEIVDGFLDMADDLADKIGKKLDDKAPAFGEAGGHIIAAIIKGGTGMLGSVRTLGSSILEGIKDGLTGGNPIDIGSVLGNIITGTGDAVSYAADLGGKILDGITDSIEGTDGAEIGSAVLDTVETITDHAGDFLAKGADAGLAIISGLADAVTGGKTKDGKDIVDIAFDTSKKLTDGIQSWFEDESHVSQLGEDLGNILRTLGVELPLSIMLGMLDGLSDVNWDAFANGVIDGIVGAISQISLGVDDVTAKYFASKSMTIGEESGALNGFSDEQKDRLSKMLEAMQRNDEDAANEYNKEYEKLKGKLNKNQLTAVDLGMKDGGEWDASIFKGMSKASSTDLKNTLDSMYYDYLSATGTAEEAFDKEFDKATAGLPEHLKAKQDEAVEKWKESMLDFSDEVAKTGLTIAAGGIGTLVGGPIGGASGVGISQILLHGIDWMAGLVGDTGNDEYSVNMFELDNGLIEQEDTGGFETWWDEKMTSLGEWWSTKKTEAADFFTGIGTDVANLATSLGDGIATAWETGKTYVSDTVTNIGDWFGTAWDTAKTKAAEFWTAADETLGISDKAESLLETWQGVKEWWSEFKGSISETISGIGDWFGAKFDGVKQWWDDLISGIRDWWDGITQTVEDFFDGIRDWWDGVIDGLLESTGLDKIAENWDSGKSIGENLMNGIAAGIEDSDGLAATAIKKGQEIYTGLKDFFGIHSPSALMRDEIGRYIPEGIAVGIEANTSSIESAMRDIGGIIDSDSILGGTAGTHYGGAYTGSNSTTYNGGINNYIYGSSGQDAEELASAVVDIILGRIRTEGAVFA